MTESYADYFERTINAPLEAAARDWTRRLNRAGLVGPQPAQDAYQRNVWTGAAGTLVGGCGIAATIIVEFDLAVLVCAIGLAAVSVVCLLVSLGGLAGCQDQAVQVARMIDERSREADPAQWSGIPAATEGHGYLYVIQFSSGVVKAGQTVDPPRRLNEHRRNARAFNVPMTRVWVSLAHADYLANEDRLLQAIVGGHDGERAKLEYFHDADFEQVVRLAEDLLDVAR